MSEECDGCDYDGDCVPSSPPNKTPYPQTPFMPCVLTGKNSSVELSITAPNAALAKALFDYVYATMTMKPVKNDSPSYVG